MNQRLRFSKGLRPGFYPELDSGGTPEGLPEILTFFELSQPSTRVESGTVVVSTDKI